jgi:hypothetical protein
MMCDFTYDGPSEKNPGESRYVCSRKACGRVGHSPYTLDRVDGPDCQGTPRDHEWGHWLAIFLEANGLSKRAWANARAWLGFRGQCGCAKREAKLNTLGQYLYSLPARIAQRLRRSCQSKGDG